MKTITKHRLSTHMAHGSGKKLGWDELKEFDVVLTTYGTLGAELGRIEKHEEEMRSRGIREPDGQRMKKTFPFLGPKSKFYRVILDEAQCIKNRNTKAARAACRLEAVTRFCLTGTPMMNNIQELYSLFRFLRIKPYNSWQNFSDVCTRPSSYGLHLLTVAAIRLFIKRRPWQRNCR
jgi:SNF2 family DNA or RNA helicase